MLAGFEVVDSGLPLHRLTDVVEAIQEAVFLVRVDVEREDFIAGGAMDLLFFQIDREGRILGISRFLKKKVDLLLRQIRSAGCRSCSNCC